MNDITEQFKEAVAHDGLRKRSSNDGNLARGSKHIGGYYSPEVARKLKLLALEEDSTVQALLGEAIVMLLRSRGRM